MFWVLIQIASLLIAIPFMVLTHLVPALFQVCIWLTLPVYSLVVQVIGQALARGALIVLSSLLWGGMALLCMPVLQWLLPTTAAALILAVSGGLWGLCVGYQASLRWELDQWRLPDTYPGRQFGLPPDWFGHTAAHQTPHPAEETRDRGIILGETDVTW